MAFWWPVVEIPRGEAWLLFVSTVFNSRQVSFSFSLIPTYLSQKYKKQKAESHTSRVGGIVESDKCDAECESSDQEHPSKWLVPDITTDGTILVGWYSDDDPGNPYNWPRWAKIMVYIQINFYTFVVYMSSAAFTPAEVEFQATYGVPSSVGSLGMALVLLGYGIGPLLFGPLSDKPSIGRNPPYVVSFTVFLIVSVLAAVVNNVPGFLFLRFAQGFFGSPCLATGPASFADITSLINLPSGLWIWGVCAVSAPTVAPTLASLCVTSKAWQWSMWLIVWFAAPCFLLLVRLLSSPPCLVNLYNDSDLTSIRYSCQRHQAQPFYINAPGGYRL